MRHIVLLGDSIFDNAAYVRGGPDVVTHLGELVGDRAQATLVAVDGAVAADVVSQLRHIPPDATDLVLSAGGNDALGHVGLLTRRAQAGGQVLGWFADAVDGFERDYRLVVEALVGLKRRVAVCTIYNGNLHEDERKPARAALAIFNDAIQRVAREHRLPVIELRAVCTDPDDYANPIEPGVQGGRKIAAAIVRELGV